MSDEARVLEARMVALRGAPPALSDALRHPSPLLDTGRAVQLLKGRSFAAIHQLREDLPRGVQKVIPRMLSVSPSDRFPSNVVAIEVLRKALAGEAAGAVRRLLSHARADEATVRALAAGPEARHTPRLGAAPSPHPATGDAR